MLLDQMAHARPHAHRRLLHRLGRHLDRIGKAGRGRGGLDAEVALVQEWGGRVGAKEFVGPEEEEGVPAEERLGSW